LAQGADEASNRQLLSDDFSPIKLHMC